MTDIITSASDFVSSIMAVLTLLFGGTFIFKRIRMSQSVIKQKTNMGNLYDAYISLTVFIGVFTFMFLIFAQLIEDRGTKYFFIFSPLIWMLTCIFVLLSKTWSDFKYNISKVSIKKSDKVKTGIGCILLFTGYIIFIVIIATPAKEMFFKGFVLGSLKNYAILYLEGILSIFMGCYILKQFFLKTEIVKKATKVIIYYNHVNYVEKIEGSYDSFEVENDFYALFFEDKQERCIIPKGSVIKMDIVYES